MICRAQTIYALVLLSTASLFFLYHTEIAKITWRNFTVSDATAFKISTLKDLQEKHQAIKKQVLADKAPANIDAEDAAIIPNKLPNKVLESNTSPSALPASKNVIVENTKDSLLRETGYSTGFVSTESSRNYTLNTTGNNVKVISDLYNSRYLINNSDLCPDSGSGLRLIVLITSAPDHYAARRAVRMTWGHFGQRKDIALSFVIGTTPDTDVQTVLETESRTYGDIIQSDFIDSYYNLTLKSVSMLEWVDRYCREANFYLKTDDDMFINIAKLLDIIASLGQAQRTIYGRLAVGWIPNRNKQLEYYISRDQFAPSVFPSFTTGPAYLVTMDSVRDLYLNSLRHIYVNLEDVFITGIIADSLNIARVSVEEFVNGKIGYSACVVRSIISAHMISYQKQFLLWSLLNDESQSC